MQCDEFVRSAIRRKVHQFFSRNEPPTLSKVLAAINYDPDHPNLKRSSLHSLLIEIGFEFVNRKRKRVIEERDNIAVWRTKYLRKMKEFRQHERTIYFLNETWVNKGHLPSVYACKFASYTQDNMRFVCVHEFLTVLSTIALINNNKFCI